MSSYQYRKSHCGDKTIWRPSYVHNGISYTGKTQYRKSHCGDKTIWRPSYLHNGIFYIGKTASLYWIRALATITPGSSSGIYSRTMFIVPAMSDLMFWSISAQEGERWRMENRGTTKAGCHRYIKSMATVFWVVGDTIFWDIILCQLISASLW